MDNGKYVPTGVNLIYTYNSSNKILNIHAANIMTMDVIILNFVARLNFEIRRLCLGDNSRSIFCQVTAKSGHFRANFTKSKVVTPVVPKNTTFAANKVFSYFIY